MSSNNQRAPCPRCNEKTLPIDWVALSRDLTEWTRGAHHARAHAANLLSTMEPLEYAYFDGVADTLDSLARQIRASVEEHRSRSAR
jgi:hypothetical protein